MPDTANGYPLANPLMQAILIEVMFIRMEIEWGIAYEI
jgi:hypothetical protein